MTVKDKASEARVGGGGVCAGIQFSRDSLRGYNNLLKYEKIEGCEQSKAELNWISK